MPGDAGCAPAPALLVVNNGGVTESGPGSVEPLEWLVLIYKVPSEPTRWRATVWRRLKGLGAIYLQNSAAALPASITAERALKKLRHEILEMSGTAIILRSEMLAGEPTAYEAFQAARDDEYGEIVDKCHDFELGLEKEFTEEHFSFAELEENEVDHLKLVNWFAQVRSRDCLGAPGRARAQELVEKCAQSLEVYASRVYAEDPEGH